MNEKHREVHAWLEGVFGGDEIPQYEINERTVAILHDLMKKNVHQDKCASLIVEDFQQKAEEYYAESERLAGIVSKLGLSPRSLSQSGVASLQTLTSIALLLETNDASTSNLLLAMSENSRKLMKIQEARRKEQQMSSQLSINTNAALQRCTSLNKALENLEEQASCIQPELQHKAKQAGFLQSKAKEYRKNLHQSQLELSKSGADPSIYHHNLMKKSEKLKELKDKLHPMKAKLVSYHKLPPDMSLARVKLEELKREAAQLEEELSKHINLMHL